MSVRSHSFNEKTTVTWDTSKAPIGEGTFGTVYRGTLWEDGEPPAEVAVKVFKSDVKIDRSCPHRTSEREVNCLRTFKHENVARALYAASHGELTTKSPYMGLAVMELCETSLDKYLSDKKRFTHIQMPSSEEALLQIARGLDYIHGSGMVHRDMKPGNVLISKDTPAVLKITDFGFTKEYKIDGKYVYTSIDGTSCYKPQEVLHMLKRLEEEEEIEREDELIKKLRQGEEEQGKEVDIFATGCVFYKFIAENHPFGLKDITINTNIFDGIKGKNNLGKEEKMAQTDPRSYSLLKVALGMIEHDPNKRTKLSDVIAVLSVLAKIAKTPDSLWIERFDGGPDFRVVGIARQEIVIKRITRHDMLRFDRQGIEQENILRLALHHPNLVAVHRLFYVQSSMYVAMEHCAGSLEDYFSGNYQGRMPETMIGAFLQMSEGLAYIHSRGFAHKKLRPSNVLITMTNGEVGVRLKLSELATSPYNLLDPTMLPYCAPEIRAIIESEQFSFDEELYAKLDNKCDVFAMGRIFLQFVLKEVNDKCARSPIRLIDEPSSALKDISMIDGWIKTLILAMMKNEPNARKKAKDIVKEINENVTETLCFNTSIFLLHFLLLHI